METTMHVESELLVFAALTLLVCIAISVICLFRVAKMSSAYRRRVRLLYAVVGGTAPVYGFSPYVGEWPHWTALFFCLSVMGLLIADGERWRDKPPDEYLDTE